MWSLKRTRSHQELAPAFARSARRHFFIRVKAITLTDEILTPSDRARELRQERASYRNTGFYNKNFGDGEYLACLFVLLAAVWLLVCFSVNYTALI